MRHETLPASFTLPELDDENAAELLNFLQELLDWLGDQYAHQIVRYYRDLQSDRLQTIGSSVDESQLCLFPDLDPF
jgi:hypothetical protein